MRTFAPHLKITEVLTKVFRGVAQLVAFLVWDQAVAGSSPVTPTKVHQFVSVAQLVAFLVWDQAVAGSSPVTPTKVHQFVSWWIFCFT